MSPLLQDLVVALVALAAAAFVVRRIVAGARPEPSDAACEHCALGEEGGRAVRPSTTSDTGAVGHLSADRAPSQ